MGVRRVVMVVAMLGVLVGTSAVILLAARGSGVPVAAGSTTEAEVRPPAPASASASAMPSAMPSATVTPTVTPSVVPTPTVTPTVTPAVTESATESATESLPAGGGATVDPVVDDSGDSVIPDHQPAEDGHVSVTSRVTIKDNVFFITIDDGMEQDPAALRLVQERKIPVTAFLTQWTVPGNESYFRAITRYGSIQNHSMTHRSFAKPDTNLRWEICETQRRYAKAFDYRPWMLRPPYGEGVERREVLDTAASCGIEAIVMWDVVVSDGGSHIEWWSEGLRPGDIVLLHFTGDLGDALATIMDMADKAGLSPASLADYL